MTFVDSDDIMAPGAIEALMTKAVELDADIVEGSYRYMEMNGILGRHFETKNSDNVSRLRGFPWGKVFKASLFEHLCFPENYWFEDTICLFILFDMAKRMSSISHIVYYYRKNSTGISANCRGQAKALDTLYVTRRLLADRSTLGLPYDDVAYDHFLQQCRINYDRTLLTPGRNVVQAVFLETCRLRDEYFGSLRTRNEQLRNRETALLNMDFHAYARALK